MLSALDTDRLDRALRTTTQRLLEERVEEGHWVGELSTSALSTATAAFALTMVDRARGAEGEHRGLIRGGLDWLASHANSDGGWGDTVRSRSNLSTTTLCWAALSATPDCEKRHASSIEGAARWIAERIGGPVTDVNRLTKAILDVYGEDRTFSVPILTMCALAGRLGEGRDAWRQIIPLPFELAAVPHRWFKHLGLPVVSYALPALIAIGQAHHVHHPTANPLRRCIRMATRARTLRVLDTIQPVNGGFLEAVPLTSFVTMSLAGSAQVDHPTARRGVSFLVDSVRDDGSWPIDTNLATWLTTLSVNALAEVDGELAMLGKSDRRRIRDWLLDQQYREVHPYTDADPGAWAWTDLPGGVPDADDTAGALVALHHLDRTSERVQQSAAAGIGWLLHLQNRDGGVPTFCRGWGKLPFDRSGADLTAHALRSFDLWSDLAVARVRNRSGRVIEAALAYLERVQRPDGSWLPLWFGNEDAANNENPTYGTARVAIALGQLRRRSADRAARVGKMLGRASDWLADAQNPDGGWGGAGDVTSSMEETALAVDALAANLPADDGRLESHLRAGVAWLVDRVESGALDDGSAATPIGFYFANLWYYEKLYPTIFTVGALGKAAGLLRARRGRNSTSNIER